MSENLQQIWFRRITLFCLALLIFVLPIAHTATLRTIGIWLPFLLLLYRLVFARDVVFVRTGLETPFLVFLAAVAVSVPFSANVAESLGEFKGEAIIPVILFYIVYLLLDKQDDVMLLLWVLFAGSLIFSLYSFYDFVRHNGSLSHMVYRAGGLRDPGGGEAASLYHCMVMPFIFWGLYRFRRHWQLCCLVVLLLLNLVALQLTFTRAAYLAVGSEFVMVMLLFFLNRRIIAGAVALALLVTIGFTYAQKRMFRELNSAKMPLAVNFLAMTPAEIAATAKTIPLDSTTQRLAIWKTAIEKISESPITPHGFGRFLFGGEVRTVANKHYILPSVHNTFIGIWFQLGALGFIAFLWLIFRYVSICYRHWRSAPDATTKFFPAALLTMMAGYWMHNFFGDFDADDAKLLFMVLMAMGLALMQRFDQFSD